MKHFETCCGRGARGKVPESRTTRGGTMLIEAGVAIVLLGVLTMTLSDGLLAVHAIRAQAARRQIARFEAANELQSIVAMRWDDLTALFGGSAKISDAATSALPGARMTIRVVAPAGEADARQIYVELSWLGPQSGQPEAPIRLTAWAYKNARRPSP